MEHDVIDNAYAYLIGYTFGEIQFGEHLRQIKYVVTHDGRLVAPVMVAMLQTLDCVLFVPDAGEESMEIAVSLEQFEESGEHGRWVDRWQIFHGDPEDVRWAFLDVDAVRHEGSFVDGEALIRPNPLADDEAKLCRFMNDNHRDDLRRLCHHHASIDIDHPVMVGIDPLGIHVRGRFEVVRVESSEPMTDADTAQRVLVAMSRDAEATA
ncbi:MAG: DUF2470 domain-containing protein [Planctomycetota bacterium]